MQVTRDLALAPIRIRGPGRPVFGPRLAAGAGTRRGVLNIPPMDTSRSPTAGRAGTRTQTRPRRHGEPELVLGRYRLYRQLGAGGFGTVWLARDERLEREVAVKIVPLERIVGGRFEREARAAARLAHPGIVTLYEAAVDSHGAYLVSELVHGHTLEQLLDAGRLSDRDVVTIGIALCDALAHAHAHGVVHRDLKPSNVLVPDTPASPAQIAKLTDFSVARVLGGDSLTRTGDVVGTAAYMAPEQAEGRAAGPPADLYALSLVIYESLTGVNPLRDGAAAPRARRLGAHLPPLRRQRRDLPRELGQGIDLALRPRSRERGRLEDLRGCLEGTLDRVRDEPGIVADPLPRITRHVHAAAVADDSAEPRSEATADLPAPPGPARARAAGAVATAVTCAWLLAHVLTPAPIAPAAVGLLAGLLVLALPRVGWLSLTAGVTLTAVVQGRPGGALVILMAGLLPAVLLPGAGTAWPLAAGAPALGAFGLAGAWPAVASVARSAWRRAALAATGWTWLVVAGQLTGSDLYLRRLPGSPRPEAWTASVHVTVHDLLAPLAAAGAFTPAVIWAVGALVLPWLVRHRSLAADAIRVVVWATALAATAAAVAGDRLVTPRSAVIGALASGLVALAPALRRAWYPAARRRTIQMTLVKADKSGSDSEPVAKPGLDFRSMESP